MKSGYDRHLEATKQTQNVTARRTAEDSVLVLQAYQIEICEIQKVSRLLIRRQIVLLKGESHPRRVCIPRFRIVDRHREQSCRSILRRNCFAQISGKGGDPALPGKIVANNGDPARQPSARARANRRAGPCRDATGSPLTNSRIPVEGTVSGSDINCPGLLGASVAKVISQND